MTDNEIIKALECCMDEMGCTKGCPCFNPKAKGSHCTVAKKLELEKLTLDLINRQKAEIERLNKQLGELKFLESRVKSIKNNTKDTLSGALISIAEGVARYETIKEFEERFNTALSEFDLSSVGLPDYDRGYEDCMTAVKDNFGNILKEMVGENND